jgi:hypothetical protein
MDFHDKRDGIVKRIGALFTRKQPEPVKSPQRKKYEDIKKAKNNLDLVMSRSEKLKSNDKMMDLPKQGRSKPQDLSTPEY